MNNVSIPGLDKGVTSSSSYKVNSTENSLNLTITVQSPRSSDSNTEKRQNSSKHKEKSNASISSSQQQEYANSTNNVPVGKITVVPTAQLMAPKLSTKNHHEKFNPMDLTSSSISITPVNDFPKPAVMKSTEIKKDVVSITPYSEPNLSDSNASQSLYLSRQEITSSIANQNSVMVSMPIRVLQEAAIDTNSERKIDENDLDTFKGEKKRDRYFDVNHKSHDSKKRRKDQEQKIIMNSGISLSKEEQEQKQIDETVAATNYLSQIINDDPLEKRKDPIVLEDPLGSLPTTDQEKEVQMVMRSLKELQELQEKKYSPSHSPVSSSASKSIKNDVQFGFGGLYSKNDDKIRISKDDGHW